MASILLNIGKICHSQFKCNYLKNERFFLNFLFHFWNLHQFLNIFKVKKMVIGNVSPKNFVRPLWKKRRFGTAFDRQHVKVSRTLAKSPSDNFYHLFPSFWGKLIWKMSPLVVGEIFGVFFNILTANGKYAVQYCESLQLPIQMHWSKKQKNFSLFFLEITLKFKHFEKKDDCHS